EEHLRVRRKWRKFTAFEALDPLECSVLVPRLRGRPLEVAAHRVEDGVLVRWFVHPECFDEIFRLMYFRPEARRTFLLVDAVPVRGGDVQALLRARDRDVEETSFVFFGTSLQFLQVSVLFPGE